MTDSTLKKKLFYDMLRIRRAEEKIAELYPEQEMRCPVHLCIGQEAIAAGVCAHLKKEDYVMSAHRSHGHYLAKGGNLSAMMAELWGKETGCSGGMGGSMHLIDLNAGFLGATPILASTIAIAVGTAFGARMKNEKRVTVVFFGEAATEEGTFHEAVNFAAVEKLPVLFVCENNLYSVYSPLSVRQPDTREVYELAKGHGIPATQADGNDVMAVHKLAGNTIAKIRKVGKGPVFLEFSTYRWREHCGPNYDNHIGYRTEAEFKEWKKKCPIENFQKKLLWQKLLTSKELEQITMKIDREVDEAVEYAKKSPFPSTNNLLERVYA